MSSAILFPPNLHSRFTPAARLQHVSDGALDSAHREAVAGPSPLAGLRHSFERLGTDEIRQGYLAQNEFVWLDELLPPKLTAALVSEADRLRPQARRKYVPMYKKSGSISYYMLLDEAPTITALYRDPALIQLLETITGVRLTLCPDEDPHACALYYYTEPGDHIGWHYDSSHYKGQRYTVLIGLVERSTSRLMCQLHRGDPKREPVHLRVATTPGTLVLFNGDKLYHAVSPLGDGGEERVVLTFEYVTNAAMSPLRRSLSNLKDAMTYFGFGELWRSRARRGGR